MTANQKDGEDKWTKNWDARMNALTSILGPSSGTVFHATIPFHLRAIGGTADVVSFPNYLSGVTYVTAELTGDETEQLPSSLGNYELMICTKAELVSAVDYISRLACYTCDAVLEPGHTIDIGDFFDDVSLRAVLLVEPDIRPDGFNFLGQQYGLLLCIGITADELQYAHNNGSDALLENLKSAGVYPYTIPGRQSVMLKPT